MIERILRWVFPYDEHGDAIGRSVLIVKPSMFSPETTVNIGWTTDAQDGYEISGFPEERPFLPLPQTLAIVRKSDLDAANERIAALEAQVAEMQAHSAAAFVREVTQRMNRLDPQEYPEFYDAYELVAHEWGIDGKETGDD